MDLRACSRLGIDVTKRCNWRCQTCFYRWSEDFNKEYDKPLDEVMIEIDAAKARGCDHVVAVGWGEPGMYKHILHMIKYCKINDMTSSIITNGSLKVQLYEQMYQAGLNHLHISVHGMGKVLDEIAGVEEAGVKQANLLQWLKVNKLPFRTNTTLQLANYKCLESIVQELCSYHPFHSVLLGFLPHYHWGEPHRIKQVAVHPAVLQEHIEKAIEVFESNNVFCTLRYHPLCHLKKKYWKYVTNAMYVLLDPWEWDYGMHGKDGDAILDAAIAMGQSVAIKDYPCNECDAFFHCGGWNETYAKGFNGADLSPITLPEEEKEPGFFFMQNPINKIPGVITEGSCL